jgi:hypothetical protein
MIIDLPIQDLNNIIGDWNGFYGKVKEGEELLRKS